MIARMNQREKFLLMITAGVIGVVANIFLINFFFTSRTAPQAQLGSTRAKIEMLRSRSRCSGGWRVASSRRQRGRESSAGSLRVAPIGA